MPKEKQPVIPFSCRLRVETASLLDSYAKDNGVTKTEALERAIHLLADVGTDDRQANKQTNKKHKPKGPFLPGDEEDDDLPDLGEDEEDYELEDE